MIEPEDYPYAESYSYDSTHGFLSGRTVRYRGRLYRIPQPLLTNSYDWVYKCLRYKTAPNDDHQEWVVVVLSGEQILKLLKEWSIDKANNLYLRSFCP